MKNENLMPWEVYTDGSCKTKYGHGFGGWAYIITRDGKMIKAGEGSAVNATNQSMELMAAVEALKVVSKLKKDNEIVKIYSDSAYLVNCYLKGWWRGWTHNGWTNYHGEPVANYELWWKLIPYFDMFAYTFIKVKGHSNNYWNNKCDEIAQSAAEKARDTWRGLENE